MSNTFEMPEPASRRYKVRANSGAILWTYFSKDYPEIIETEALYTSEQVKEILEQCIKEIDAYSTDRRALYKGRPPYKGHEPGRADQYTDGQSDGANEAEQIVRKIKEMVK